MLMHTHTHTDDSYTEAPKHVAPWAHLMQVEVQPAPVKLKEDFCRARSPLNSCRLWSTAMGNSCFGELPGVQCWGQDCSSQEFERCWPWAWENPINLILMKTHEVKDVTESCKDWMTGTSDPYCVCRPNGKAGQIWKGTLGAVIGLSEASDEWH